MTDGLGGGVFREGARRGSFFADGLSARRVATSHGNSNTHNSITRDCLLKYSHHCMGQIFLEYSWTILFKTIILLTICDIGLHCSFGQIWYEGRKSKKGKCFLIRFTTTITLWACKHSISPTLNTFGKKTFLHKYFSPLQWAKYEPSMSLVAISYCRLAHAGSFFTAKHLL